MLFNIEEVDTLLGDASKVKKKLGWRPRVTFKELVKEMVREDLVEAERDHLCRTEGFRVMKFHE